MIQVLTNSVCMRCSQLSVTEDPPLVHMLTCTTPGMIKSMVTSEPAHVQYKEALVFECSQVGRTHGLLV